MPRRSLARLYKDEFSDYSPAKFQQDLLAGLTVAAVALPLARVCTLASLSYSALPRSHDALPPTTGATVEPPQGPPRAAPE